MQVTKRFKNYIRKVKKQKRKYASYVLILSGFGMLVEHLLVSGATWDIYQLYTCHGFVGFILIAVGFLLGARRKNKRTTHGDNNV